MTSDIVAEPLMNLRHRGPGHQYLASAQNEQTVYLGLCNIELLLAGMIDTKHHELVHRMPHMAKLARTTLRNYEDRGLTPLVRGSIDASHDFVVEALIAVVPVGTFTMPSLRELRNAVARPQEAKVDLSDHESDKSPKAA